MNVNILTFFFSSEGEERKRKAREKREEGTREEREEGEEGEEDLMLIPSHVSLYYFFVVVCIV